MTTMGIVADMAVNTVAIAGKGPRPATSISSLCSHFNFGISIRVSASENAAGGRHTETRVDGKTKLPAGIKKGK